MSSALDLYLLVLVALHPEGVDRNSTLPKTGPKISVALHPEGVDRNFSISAHKMRI